jgi:hypothetical protein
MNLCPLLTALAFVNKELTITMISNGRIQVLVDLMYEFTTEAGLMEYCARAVSALFGKLKEGKVTLAVACLGKFLAIVDIHDNLVHVFHLFVTAVEGCLQLGVDMGNQFCQVVDVSADTFERILKHLPQGAVKHESEFMSASSALAHLVGVDSLLMIIDATIEKPSDSNGKRVVRCA